MHQIRKFLSHHPVFLLTMPGAYLIHTASYYHPLLDWQYIGWEVFLCVAVPVALYALAAWRGAPLRERTGAILVFCLLVFYFFHLLQEWLKSAETLRPLARYSVLLPVIGAAFIAWVIFVMRHRTFYRLYYAVNLLFGLLFIGGLGEYIYVRMSVGADNHHLAGTDRELSRRYTPCNDCEKPDIYYILLDGYTNSKTLQSEFNYANAWITDFLKDRGFFLMPDSRSNYYFTQVCQASVLNMMYLPLVDTGKLFQTKEFFQAAHSVYDNELCRILEKEGYEINNYSIFDIRENPSRITPFLQELHSRSVTGQTFFNKVYRDIGWHLGGLLEKQRLKRSLHKVETDITRMQQARNGVMRTAKANRQRPQFTYAHFLLPHETFYFDSTGQSTDRVAIMKRGYTRADYVQQVSYTNRFVIAPLVDSIFAHSKRPFVIILQGDHGYRNYPPEKLHLEFENFYAVYFPDRNYSRLRDAQTSVNTFRVVMNQFFGQQMPLLKDSVIYLRKRNMEGTLRHP